MICADFEMIFMQNRILLRNPLNSLLRPTVLISLEFLHIYYATPPLGWDIKRWWPSSVRLSVPCLILSREWKDTASRKLTERKHMTLVTRDPIYKLKGQRLMSPGRLILRRKMRRIFRRGRPTNLKTWFRDGVRWPASPTCAVAGHVEVQRSR